MKWAVTMEDLEKYAQKIGGSNVVAGYVEDYHLFNIPGYRYYVIVVNDEGITLIHLSLKMEVKSERTIHYDDIEAVTVSGLLLKKVTIKTKDDKIALLVKTTIIGLGAAQKSLLERLAHYK